MRKQITILFLSLGFLAACERPEKEQEEVNPQPEAYRLQVPAHFPDLPPMPEQNPLTVQGVELGRMLFYDPLLSGNNNVSCASCHQQDKAFSDGKALSDVGVSGQQLKRHAPALINLAWTKGLFWDGGAKNLESLAFAPLTSPDEMGQDLNELERELQSHPDYPRLFKLAFGTDKVQSTLVARALAQFQRTLISGNSLYDKYVRGDNDLALNTEQLEGFTLYWHHCLSCHGDPLMTDNDYHNNGLDDQFSSADERLQWGRGRITNRQEDIGKYKTPTLRNIALTAPYMHDGRFQTLKQVLDHYHTGIKKSPSLSQELIDENGQVGIPLTEDEKEKIIVFLHTLTDQEFTQNKAFSNPF